MLAIAILGPVLVLLALLFVVAGLLRLRAAGPAERRRLRRFWRVLMYGWAVALVVGGVWWMVTGHLDPAWIAILSMFGMIELVLLWDGGVIVGDDEDDD